MSTLLDPKERTARGVALQTKIYGEAPSAPQTPWEESVRDFVYAEVWSRPGLELRARFLIAIAGSALCRYPERTIDGVVAGAPLVTVHAQAPGAAPRRLWRLGHR